MGALCCVGADLAVLGALGWVGCGFGSGGRAGLGWVWIWLSVYGLHFTEPTRKSVVQLLPVRSVKLGTVQIHKNMYKSTISKYKNMLLNPKNVPSKYKSIFSKYKNVL